MIVDSVMSGRQKSGLVNPIESKEETEEAPAKQE
jgi:hypothetical protein